VFDIIFLSHHKREIYIIRTQVRWRPVLWGLGLQFALGVLILRWKPGFLFFQYLGEKVRVFLEFADKGSVFVFGEKGLEDHEMAFKVRLLRYAFAF